MKKAKRLALSSVGAALGTVVLYVGSIIEVLDISSACIASLVILFFASETGAVNTFTVYSVISALSLILLPQKLPALMFALIFGLMPLIRLICGKLGRLLNTVIKFIVYNAGATALYFIGGALLGIPAGAVWIAAYYVCCNVLFFICDLLYARLEATYYIRIKPKIEKYLR